MSAARDDRPDLPNDVACDFGGPRAPSPPVPAGDTAQLFAALSTLGEMHENLDWITHLGLLYEKDHLALENARLKSTCEGLEADLLKARESHESLHKEYTLLYDTSLRFRERMVPYLVQLYKLSDASQCFEQDEYHQRAFAAALEWRHVVFLLRIGHNFLTSYYRRREIEYAGRQLLAAQNGGDFLPFYARVHADEALLPAQGQNARTPQG